MAQQDKTPQAAAQAGTDRTHFLVGLGTMEYKCNAPAMGRRGVGTSVCVFDEKPEVMVALTSGAFSLYNMLTAEEARTLAQALNLAADHAQERAEAAQADDWLASNAAAQKLCGVVA